MPRVCQAVLTALVLVSGCYGAHERGRAHPTDAAVAPTDARVLGTPDAGPVLDAPAADAPVACPLRRPDASCLGSFAIPAGSAFELPFQFDTCTCCVHATCDVSVDAATRTLRITTGLCDDECLCDECETPRGTCSVPPLPLSALGPWTVEANGVVAFAIGVVDTFDPSIPAPPGCATYAEIDTCGAVPDLTTGPVRGDLCVELADRIDRYTLRMRSGCWSCGQLDSECQAIVSPRHTDDLPPGGDITLLARDYWTRCDVDCPGACIEHERECDLPPLVRGELYRVFVDGEVVHTFTAGEPPPACVMR